ncbi:MAG: hypothetical protein L0Y71_00870 [Gemmataceae bacterium]|nr:hypothetical protein [Gemmataceae bacterium]
MKHVTQRCAAVCGLLVWFSQPLPAQPLPAQPLPAQPLPAQPTKSTPATDDWNRMLLAIMRNDLSGNAGWFGPSETRYTWAWVQEHLDPAKRGAVSAQNSGLPPASFDRLDRDGDGRWTAADFDWSEKGPLAQKTSMARMFLMRADQDRNGKLSQDEWNTVFERLSKGTSDLDLEELRKLLFPAPPPRPKGPPPDMPSTTTLLQGLYRGELGSPFPGPRLGDFAPDFTLPTHDGKTKINLRSFRGHKPVALIFGSFT